MILRVILVLVLNSFVFLFCSCQNSQTEKVKMEAVNGYMGTYILFDVLDIYKNNYQTYPDSLIKVISLYENGETSFGFDSNILDDYIRDPFNPEDYLRYILINDSSYILYSVGPNELDDNFSKIKELINTDKIHKLDFNEYIEGEDAGDILIYYVLDSIDQLSQ